MRLALSALLFAFTLPALAADPPLTALADYVKKEDKSFAWKLKDKVENNGNTVYTLALTSQTWQGLEWTHDLQIFVPKGTKVQPTMVIWNQGGTASPTAATLGTLIAEKVGAPIAFLYGIPKQPLYKDEKGGKLTTTPPNPANDREGRLVEDALIAETFVRFLATKDESWPLLFPMVKSLVRAMDTVQAFAKEELKADVQKFLITGASKRGWTSWLTAASGDQRVKAIAPLVIDTLHFPVQMQNQLKAFGKPSEMIADYTRNKLVPIPDTPEAKKLWQMVDPYMYRDSLTVPKMIINGTNDPYWPQDALNSYWGDLKGEKYVCYVPNAGHGLQQEDEKGKKELIPLRAINTLAAFGKAQVFDKPMPKFDWTLEKGAITLKAGDEPAKLRLWKATADTRDFRKSRWTSEELNPSDAKSGTAVKVAPPEKGLLAAFVEAEFRSDLGTTHQSTQILILEAKK
ncbi:MAG: PhoPQ-activated pathogenicity-related family protein [Fimbriiglobus sp.]|nr:PhoPQ-activated pathogenicity-related family protein [Fimbriiglobus sp.]